MHVALARPFAVTTPEGQTTLLVMDAKRDGLPAAFALMGTRASRKVALRISGGCKGMGPEDKGQMLEMFREAFQGYDGLVWSGGTRQIASDGTVDPMVTDLPGVIAVDNPGCVALGTCPRTALLRLKGDSRLILDDYGTAPNPTMSGILIVQDGPDGTLDWDGDLEAYFRLMDQWRDHAGFTALGLVAWNGGPVTRDEILRSAKRRWPTILVRGSGRATDEVIGVLEAANGAAALGVPADAPFVVVDRDDANALRVALTTHGFLA